jgi:hypothetical protein
MPGSALAVCNGDADEVVRLIGERLKNETRLK